MSDLISDLRSKLDSTTNLVKSASQKSLYFISFYKDIEQIRDKGELSGLTNVLDSYHLSSMNLNIDELEDLVLSNRLAIKEADDSEHKRPVILNS